MTHYAPPVPPLPHAHVFSPLTSPTHTGAGVSSSFTFPSSGPPSSPSRSGGSSSPRHAAAAASSSPRLVHRVHAIVPIAGYAPSFPHRAAFEVAQLLPRPPPRASDSKIGKNYNATAAETNQSWELSDASGGPRSAHASRGSSPSHKQLYDSPAAAAGPDAAALMMPPSPSSAATTSTPFPPIGDPSRPSTSSSSPSAPPSSSSSAIPLLFRSTGRKATVDQWLSEEHKENFSQVIRAATWQQRQQQHTQFHSVGVAPHTSAPQPQQQPQQPELFLIHPAANANATNTPQKNAQQQRSPQKQPASNNKRSAAAPQDANNGNNSPPATAPAGTQHAMQHRPHRPSFSGAATGRHKAPNNNKHHHHHHHAHQHHHQHGHHHEQHESHHSHHLPSLTTRSSASSSSSSSSSPSSSSTSPSSPGSSHRFFPGSCAPQPSIVPPSVVSPPLPLPPLPPFTAPSASSAASQQQMLYSSPVKNKPKQPSTTAAANSTQSQVLVVTHAPMTPLSPPSSSLSDPLGDDSSDPASFLASFASPSSAAAAASSRPPARVVSSRPLPPPPAPAPPQLFLIRSPHSSSSSSGGPNDDKNDHTHAHYNSTFQPLGAGIRNHTDIVTHNPISYHQTQPSTGSNLAQYTFNQQLRKNQQTQQAMMRSEAAQPINMAIVTANPQSNPMFPLPTIVPSAAAAGSGSGLLPSPPPPAVSSSPARLASGPTVRTRPVNAFLVRSDWYAGDGLDDAEDGEEVFRLGPSSPRSGGSSNGAGANAARGKGAVELAVEHEIRARMAAAQLARQGAGEETVLIDSSQKNTKQVQFGMREQTEHEKYLQQRREEEEKQQQLLYQTPLENEPAGTNNESDAAEATHIEQQQIAVNDNNDSQQPSVPEQIFYVDPSSTNVDATSSVAVDSSSAPDLSSSTAAAANDSQSQNEAEPSTSSPEQQQQTQQAQPDQPQSTAEQQSQPQSMDQPSSDPAVDSNATSSSLIAPLTFHPLIPVSHLSSSLHLSRSSTELLLHSFELEYGAGSMSSSAAAVAAGADDAPLPSAPSLPFHTEGEWEEAARKRIDEAAALHAALARNVASASASAAAAAAAAGGSADASSIEAAATTPALITAVPPKLDALLDALSSSLPATELLFPSLLSSAPSLLSFGSEFSLSLEQILQQWERIELQLKGYDDACAQAAATAGAEAETAQNDAARTDAQQVLYESFSSLFSTSLPAFFSALHEFSQQWNEFLSALPQLHAQLRTTVEQMSRLTFLLAFYLSPPQPFLSALLGESDSESQSQSPHPSPSLRALYTHFILLLRSESSLLSLQSQVALIASPLVAAAEELMGRMQRTCEKLKENKGRTEGESAAASDADGTLRPLLEHLESNSNYFHSLLSPPSGGAPHLSALLAAHQHETAFMPELLQYQEQQLKPSLSTIAPFVFYNKKENTADADAGNM